MGERYRLEYFDYRKSSFSIRWVQNKEDYILGDCRVKAIKEGTDLNKHAKRSFQQKKHYMGPLDIEEVKKYLTKHQKMLGTYIPRCIGLTLEDSLGEFLDFDEPVEF